MPAAPFLAAVLALLMGLADARAEDVACRPGDPRNQRLLELERDHRYPEAAPLILDMLVQQERTVGPDHPELLPCLERVTLIMERAGRQAEAELYHQRWRVMRVKVPTELLAAQERTLGPDHLDVAATLDRLAAAHDREGRDDLVEPLYRRSLAIREKALGPDHPDVAASLIRLAGVNQRLNRPVIAEPLYRRAAEITERTQSVDHPDALDVVFRRAEALHQQSRYGEAEPLYQRVLAAEAALRASDSIWISTLWHRSLNQLAELYFAQRRFAEAEPLYQRQVALLEQQATSDTSSLEAALDMLAQTVLQQGRPREAAVLQARSTTLKAQRDGDDHPGFFAAIGKLAEAEYASGNYTEAATLYARVAAFQEKTYGESPILARSLNDLATVYLAQGRDREAEPLFRRALEMWEALGRGEHRDAAKTLNNLAGLYQQQGRLEHVVRLRMRALDILESQLGAQHPDVAHGLDGVASLLVEAHRYKDAERLHTRALAIRIAALGPDHPDVAGTLNGLGTAISAQGRGAEAATLYERSLAIRERALGAEHPHTGDSLVNLAVRHAEDGRAADAAKLLGRAATIYRTALGVDHPRVAAALSNLAAVQQSDGRLAAAIASSRRAVEILARRLAVASDDSDRAIFWEQRSRRGYFLQNIALVAQGGASAAAAETFRVAQLAQASSAGRALLATAARFSAGGDALATVVRERQDLAARLLQLDAALLAAAGELPRHRDAAAEATLRDQHGATAARLDAIDARIAAEFPRYAELSNPPPLDMMAAQALLAPEEALLVYIVAPSETWLWVVRRHGAAFHRIAIGAIGLEREVAALRDGLDPAQNTGLRPFDVRRAHALHQTILAPASPLLDGARHILVVPDGALQSIPMGVLVTEPPTLDPNLPAEHRKVAWLSRRHAVTVLPVVGSLRALREGGSYAPASLPFGGIGNPVLQGKPGAGRGAKLASLFRGAIADVGAVRELAPLPETADELRAIATALGASEHDLWLAERASERQVRQASLERFRVLSFATHGLMSGDLTGLAEPALVLTPPAEGSADDDGLLTASEVAQLKLNADWVVLSACNTAAPDGTPDADGLSGLAKAFFYAGARSLLVSHWSVPSLATVKLITGAFQALRKDPSIGRAEALRRSQLVMLDDEALPSEFAHPLAWAPFVLAGEGGAGR